MANDNWDFSAYDMDLSKLDKTAEKQTTDDHFEFDLPEVPSIESENPKEDSPIKKETIVSQPYDNQSQKAEQRLTEDHPQTIRQRPTPPKKEPTIMNGRSIEKASRMASKYLLPEIRAASGIITRSKPEITPLMFSLLLSQQLQSLS